MSILRLMALHGLRHPSQLNSEILVLELSAVQLSSSAFLASSISSGNLVSCILPLCLQAISSPYLAEAQCEWSIDNDKPSPPVPVSHRQKVWDLCKMAVFASRLLEASPDVLTKAQILASSTKEAGAWLHTIPLSSLDLCMDDDTMRIVVGLRLGAPLCRPHTCCHCGEKVGHLGVHGLSCRRSEGGHHTALNSKQGLVYS